MKLAVIVIIYSISSKIYLSLAFKLLITFTTRVNNVLTFIKKKFFIPFTAR